MFYGSLGAVTRSRVLVRATHCSQGALQGTDYICSLCDSGYLPNDNGKCVECAWAASCDLSQCTNPQVFFNGDTSLSATCSLTSTCGTRVITEPASSLSGFCSSTKMASTCSAATMPSPVVA